MMGHSDMKHYEEEIEGCKESRKWLDYHGKPCDGRGDHTSMMQTNVVSLSMSVPMNWSPRHCPKIATEAVMGLLRERWPELSMALRVTIDKRETNARKCMRELARKILEEVK